MSKVSSANYPAYTGSSISIGDSKATTGVTNGLLTSSYDMSDNESAIYNYALSALANILPQINTFNTDTLSALQSEVGAYQDSGIATINKLYNSSLSKLENDVASRFGNLDNSIFMDNLSDIESERANSVSSFAQDVLAKQSELKSDELSQRYALVELLSGLADNTYRNALNAISTALSGSANATDYSTEIYNALNSSNRTNSNSANSLVTGLLGLTGNTGASSIFNI